MKFEIFSPVRKVLKLLKPSKGQKSISYLGFKKLIRNGNEKDLNLLKNYQEYLTNLKAHENLAKSYKLITNTNDDERYRKTAEYCGLKMNPITGNVETDLKSFEKF